MFCDQLMNLCCFKLENGNFEQIITYFLVEKITGGGEHSWRGGTIRDNMVFVAGLKYTPVDIFEVDILDWYIVNTTSISDLSISNEITPGVTNA